MACSIPAYIDKAAISEAEKERLSGIESDIFNLAEASGAFRKVNGEFHTYKHRYPDATNFIGKVITKFGKVVSLPTVEVTKSGKVHKLQLNVLPLSIESQVKIEYTDRYPLFGNTSTPDNHDIKKYFSTDIVEPKVLLEQLIRDEGETETKKGLEVLLRNVDKIKAPITLEVMEGMFGVFKVEKKEDIITTSISINPKAVTETPQQARHSIAHELHHAYSVGILTNPQTPEEVNFTRNIKRLLEDARKQLGQQQGTENEFEFLAELASNSSFRAQLRNNTDLWSRLLRLFRKLLGLQETYDKVLDQYYTILDQTEHLQKTETGTYLLKSKFTKEQKATKKRLDALEQMLHSLYETKARQSEKGQTRKKQETQKTIEELKNLMIDNRTKAVILSLTTINKEMLDLTKIYETLEKDPAKINPDALIQIGTQLTSYSVLDAFSDEIQRDPKAFVLKEEHVVKLKTQLQELRVKVELMLRDIKHLNTQRVAWFVKQNSTNPNKTYEDYLDEATVADRDITWWNRLFESARGVRDSFVAAVFRTLDRVFSTAHRESLTQDIYRKESREETLDFKTWGFTTENEYGWLSHKIKFKSVGVIKAEEDYEGWLKKKGYKYTTPVDKYKHIIITETLQENGKGVRFISPLSKEGEAIMKIKEGSEDFPLRQYYETVVLGYMKSQESIPNPQMRPGTRIPSIQRSLFEGLITESGLDKFRLFKEKFIQTIRKRYDETDYRAVDANLEPIHYLPTRFTSKQDGNDGRMSTREVSLDVGTTVAIFMQEMRTREGMMRVQSDLELTKQTLGERKTVTATKRLSLPGIAGLLSSERKAGHDPNTGILEHKEGYTSESYKMVETLLRRFMYGEFKKDGGEIEVFGKKFSLRKSVDLFMKYTGLNIMLGNVAIPLTNVLVSEITLFKEAVGGNLITFGNLKAGQARYKDAALGAIKDLGEREKKSKWGRFYMYFNPLGQDRPADNIGIDSNWMRTTMSQIFRTGNGIAEYKMASTAIGAVLDRFKAKDNVGKEVTLYDAIEVDMSGKVVLSKGFTYKDKTTLEEGEVNKIRDYVARVYELANGNYTRIGSPGATEYIWGDLILFMRRWLPEGVGARWRTKYYDESLNKDNEGYYISALIMLNNSFSKKGMLQGAINSLKILSWFSVKNPELLLLPNELSLPEEQKQELINLRRAGIRKAVFDVYIIAALSLAIFMLGSGDDEDKDSYALYMLARIRREMWTFISPTTAWDVLRSPTVVMNSVQGIRKVIWDINESGWAFVTGEDQPEYQRGENKGEDKLWVDIKRQLGARGFLYQFDELTQKNKAITQGGWR